MISKKALFFIASASIIFNILAFVFIFSGEKKNLVEDQSLRSKFPFLSPRIFVENPNDRLVNFVTLRQDLNKYHENAKKDFGFYFEYLPSGVSIGANERENFVSASLLKTPLAMGIYGEIEKKRIYENDILTIKKTDIDPDFGDLWKKGEGTNLTLRDAVEYMLIYSDNTAKNLLFSAVPEGTMERVFDSLDIPKEAESGEAVVSPKNYSSILRSLYLSSYLTEENSSEILYLLTQSPFNDKLVAGVPKNIKVAHKIGVHKGSIAGQEVFTDCGIIYVPKRPYILCIMARENEKTSGKIMKDISEMVYEYVSNAKYAQNTK